MKKIVAMTIGAQAGRNLISEKVNVRINRNAPIEVAFRKQEAECQKLRWNRRLQPTPQREWKAGEVHQQAFAEGFFVSLERRTPPPSGITLR